MSFKAQSLLSLPALSLSWSRHLIIPRRPLLSFALSLFPASCPADVHHCGVFFCFSLSFSQISLSFFLIFPPSLPPLDPGRDMKRHHGFYGILPGDWPRHPEPHHPGRQLCHPAARFPHLLHPVRLPWQRPHQGVRPWQHASAAQPVAHTPGGHAELAHHHPVRAQQQSGPRRAADAGPEPG